MKHSVSEYPQFGANMLYNSQKRVIFENLKFSCTFQSKSWLKTLNGSISQEAWLSTSTCTVVLASLLCEQ